MWILLRRIGNAALVPQGFGPQDAWIDCESTDVVTLDIEPYLPNTANFSVGTESILTLGFQGNPILTLGFPTESEAPVVADNSGPDAEWIDIELFDPAIASIDVE